MESAQELRESTWKRLPGRGMRFVLRWLIKLTVLGVIHVWRRKLVTALILAAALAMWWFGSGGLLLFASTPRASSAAGPSFERFSTSVPSVPPAAGPEQYLLGQSRYDAQMMWATVGEEMKRSTTARGGGMTLQRLEQQIDEAKKNGLHYDQVSYVGGYLSPDGRGFYLYTVGISSGAQTEHVPYTFTVSKEGKILSID